ncbi:MAG: hypothetical protein K9M55_03625 [Candidatus Marinimicrobia bacterium]|nr:hypothetical protein [Candidatus Neomarinimicrobiota bacterium]MCF7921769.1 hypothetical protein [Candidatus Neomarinimicrobiota bacterium]
MIRNLCLLLLLIFPVYGENIGSLFLGTSSIGGNNEFRPRNYEVNYGVSAGFLLPIRFPIIDAHYKVRAAYHPAISNRSYDHTDYGYVSASNVLLAGKTITPGPFKLLPQLGLGLIYEVIFDEWGSGYLYNLLFLDYSVKVTLPRIPTRWGLLFNFEQGIETSMPDYMPMDRFHVSLVYTY